MFNFFPYFLWLLPLAFFTFQFILRLSPSLMMQEIMQQFALDAAFFGLLSSSYYYGYAGMQIPLALLLDRYGPRYVIFGCATVVGMATLLFCLTTNWYLALLSRTLIGAGSAVGFLGTSKVISMWFKKEEYTRMVSFSFTIGLMGAIYGGKPMSLLIDSLGWQKVSFILAAVAISIGIMAYLFLRSPDQKHVLQEQSTVGSFKKLLTSPVLWLLAISNLLMVGSLEGFADVWGVNYLMTAYNLSKGNAAELTSFIFVGMLFGGPLLAFCSQKLGNCVVISCCGFCMAFSFFALMLFNALFNWYLLATLFFFIGMMSCYQVIVFAVGSELVSKELLGITVAFLNCINMLGGSFFHTLIGFFMDLFWTGTMQGDLRLYNLEAYQYSLLVIPVCAAMGALLVHFVSKKKVEISLAN